MFTKVLTSGFPESVRGQFRRKAQRRDSGGYYFGTGVEQGGFLFFQRVLQGVWKKEVLNGVLEGG